MHRILLDAATGEGKGTPAKLIVNHKCRDIDLETGVITFENDVSVQHEVIIGSDGIGSAVRKIIGIVPNKKPAPQSCLHANVDTETAVKLGLIDYSQNSALEYWGGHEDWNKIVLSPCNGGSLLSYYCFFSRDVHDYSSQNWNSESTTEELLSPYPDLDKGVFKHLTIGKEIRPWKLWMHEPYPYWQKGLACVMGDAAHPVYTSSRWFTYRTSANIDLDDATSEPGSMHGNRRRSVPRNCVQREALQRRHSGSP